MSTTQLTYNIVNAITGDKIVGGLLLLNTAQDQIKRLEEVPKGSVHYRGPFGIEEVKTTTRSLPCPGE